MRTAAKRASLAADYAALFFRRSFAAAKPVKPRFERILVLGYDGIGDLIFALPAYRALRDAFPKARLVLYGDRDVGTKVLLERIGVFDEIRLHRRGRLEDADVRVEISRSIRAEKFDAVMASPGVPLRAFARPLLDIPLRVGHCRPLAAPHAGWSLLRYALWRLRRGVVGGEFERRAAFNAKVWDMDETAHMVDRNLRLLEPFGVVAGPQARERPALPENAEERRFAERALALPSGKLVVGLHIGAPESQYDKIWPAEKWGAVCRELAVSLDCEFVVFGGASEAATARRFGDAFGRSFVDLTARADLLETCATMRRCALIVGNDTGLLKAATALGVPTATVWGPTDPLSLGAYWDKERHLDVLRRVPCMPCVDVGLRREGDGVLNFAVCGHHDCLARLDSGAVAAAIKSRFSGSLKAPR